jgi:hypothetical protein
MAFVKATIDFKPASIGTGIKCSLRKGKASAATITLSLNAAAAKQANIGDGDEGDALDLPLCAGPRALMILPADEAIGPRQQELLSYLQGLAPVGETIEIPLAWIAADLGFRNRSAIRNLIAKLICHRLIHKVASGQRSSCGLLQVLKRVEDLAPKREKVSWRCV